jgi:hypothetical protein
MLHRKKIFSMHRCKLVRLSLSAESVSHSTVFFSDNKSTNNTYAMTY